MAGLTLAPSVDQPTITFASVGAGAVSTIAGSPGWLREKRIGVAENAPGAAQTSTADLDLTGSTRFRYPGLPTAPGYAANIGQYVASTIKPGASSQAAYWPFNVEFVTSSPTVEIRMNAPVANPNVGRILVNGLPIVDTTTSITSTATAGGGYAMKLTFSTSASRTITIIGLNNVQGRFGGVAIESGYTVTKPTDTLTRIAFIGDSYVNGASPVGLLDTFAWRVASILGYGRNVILGGVGGTGYQTMIGSDPNSLFVNRVSAVMAMNPDIVLLEGGRNDPSAGQQAAVEAVIDAIRALGSPTIYVSNSSSNSAQAAVNTAMQAAAASRSATWIPQDVDSLPKVADAVHPTQAGHVTLADMFVTSMASGSSFSATVDLTGSGGLSGAASPALAVDVTLGGGGTLSGAAARSATVPVSLSGSGSLTGSATPAATSSVSLSGAGTLTAAATPGRIVAAALTGSGTLSAVGSANGAAAVGVALSGVGTLSATAVAVRLATVVLTGVGQLSAIASGGVDPVAPPTLTLARPGPQGDPFTVSAPTRSDA